MEFSFESSSKCFIFVQRIKTLFLGFNLLIASKMVDNGSRTHRNIQLFNFEFEIHTEMYVLADGCVSVHMTRLTYISFHSIHIVFVCLYVCAESNGISTIGWIWMRHIKSNKMSFFFNQWVNGTSFKKRENSSMHKWKQTHTHAYKNREKDGDRDRHTETDNQLASHGKLE